MARRRKSSPADDLMDLIALLPWWAGVGLALLSYWWLHGVATTPLPAASSPQDIGRLGLGAVWRGFAHAGQYALPFICILGALTSAVRRWRRRTLLDNVSQSKAADALDGMSWREFELLVGEGFRRQGYAVTETAAGADGGIDLVLGKAGEKFLVQCKQWRAFKVGVGVVRELYGVMAARGAAGGFVVTSGRFTDEATAFASGRNIRLIDGPALLRLIRQGRDAPQASDASASQPRERASAAPVASPDATPPAGGAPGCPICAKSMVRRVAKRGASAGSAFWGCAAYPGCRGTRPV